MSLLSLRSRSRSGAPHWVYMFLYHIFTIPKIYSLPLITGSHALNSRDVADSGHSVGDEASVTTYYIISIILVLLGGVFAGLTLGLMGQDEVYLKVISTSGSNSEKKLAKRVLDLISKGKHWVLVTLLLSNVITNETLPIVLDRCLGGGWQAVVSSTILIVIFGEIIPQSVCVKYGLQVGAFFCPFVLVLMYLMYPVAYPIATLLDYMLGEDHGTMYKKSGLKTLVTLHRTMGVERLTKDEVTIISAVLDLKAKRVEEIMTPIENVFTMSADTILDDKTVEKIFNSGFSRIPIFLPNEPNNFIGMLLVRVLISYDPDDCLPISHFPLATLPETSPNTSCLNILNYFQEGKAHMCVVSKEPGSSHGAIGVLTLEDVIEELIGEEIVDESDVFVDMHQHIMRQQPGPLSKRHITSYLHHLYTSSHKEHRAPDHTDESSPLLSPSNSNHPSVHLQQDLNSKSWKRKSNDGYDRSNAVLSPTPQPTEHGTIIPSNLASNPLNVNKSFVTIKKPANVPKIITTHTPHSSKEPSPAPHSNGKSLSAEEQQLLSDHAELSHQAILHTQRSGEPTQVTTSTKTTRNSPDSISIPNSDTDHLNENQNVTISSSYQNTKNGIVESVITVKGVPKTIIGPAKDWDESKSEHDNENINQEYSNRSDDRESSSSNASLFSSIKNKFKNENTNNNDRPNYTESLSRTSNYEGNGSSSTMKR
ncbi:Mam3p [Saccharomyces paradoxus]|uniref:Mam3p n=1 Tax=Saccharomyces paradoxus TaxID=27291 RepID=A0A8B8UZF3_SACPA|nr:Mam3 [Saccharomyces paradoxus]QHS76064.1 Mam3 [Saccharomyces paradoxus]